jgi:hypothetical protein
MAKNTTSDAINFDSQYSADEMKRAFVLTIAKFVTAFAAAARVSKKIVGCLIEFRINAASASSGIEGLSICRFNAAGAGRRRGRIF